MIQSIPLSALPDHYPAFLQNETDILPGQLRSLERFNEKHREELVRSLLGDLREWDAPAAAIRSAEKFRGENSYGVVTGQQAGIASGPLYTLYKAVSTIRVAEMLAEKYPDHEFVPVFWIEGDDHDFDEARTIHLPERSGNLRTLRYDDKDERRISVGDRKVSEEGLNAVLEEVREVIGETDFTSDLLELVRSSYSGRTLAEGFARFFYGLLGDSPLVLLSSRNAGLKRLASDIFLQEAEHPEEQYRAITTRTVAMQGEGLPTPIDPKPGALFIQHEGERRSLDPEGEEYVIRGTDVRITKGEVVRLAKEHPEQLSPNVLLRPVVQDAILPTAIYLGGPSEVAYLHQISDLYPLFGMEAPAIAPRPFVTLIEPKVLRAIEGGELTVQRLLERSFDPEDHVLDSTKTEEIESELEAGKKLIADAFGRLKGLTSEIDKSLEKTLGAQQHKAEKELENFVGRLRGGLKRKSETEIRRIEGARESLLPGGKLQERMLNILYYANKYGLESVRRMLEEIEVMPGETQVIRVGS